MQNRLCVRASSLGTNDLGAPGEPPSEKEPSNKNKSTMVLIGAALLHALMGHGTNAALTGGAKSRGQGVCGLGNDARLFGVFIGQEAGLIMERDFLVLSATAICDLSVRVRFTR